MNEAASYTLTMLGLAYAIAAAVFYRLPGVSMWSASLIRPAQYFKPSGVLLAQLAMINLAMGLILSLFEH